MLILITCLLYFVTALALVILRATQPEARYAWLVAAGGGALAFISVFVWLAQMPLDLTFPGWEPRTVFPTPIFFRADSISWVFAISVAALTLSILMTAVTRPVYTNSLSWAGTLTLGGLGILAVTANNPLTLLLLWGLLDLAELASQLGSVNGERNNERVVISFATRTLGICFLLWAYIESFAGGSPFTFQSMPVSAGVYLVIAAGLRLGVLPLHLPYAADSYLRRGLGTALRLIGAAATLSVLGRAVITSSNLLTFLMVLVSAAAMYAGWMWLRAPDELNGRPYWIISLASLAVISAVSGNPIGAAAWGSAMLLVGGTLFLFSVQDIRLNRAILIGGWSLSSLPFSLTGGAWLGSLGFMAPFVIAAQALAVAGYIRHALRAGTVASESLDEQPGWAKIVYPVGIVIPLILQVLLGFIGWDGALQTGSWLVALIASLLTFGLVWGSRRFRIFNPVRAHWVTTAGAGVNSVYQGLWSIYRGLARLALAITNTLEGEGGIMWTLLFLVLFISIIVQGAQ